MRSLFLGFILLLFLLPGGELFTQDYPPILADPGQILSWPQSSWRDRRFEVFSWDRYPEILIFDTADFEIQAKLFKRLAFFVEKSGFRGRLAHDHEIAHLHGWNAHNYRAEDLANFFQTARLNDFPLLEEEWELEYILYSAGVLRWDAQRGITAGRGAVLSISREGSHQSLRPRFMAHEVFHGLFFIDQDFRNFSQRRWEALPDYARTFFLGWLNLSAYDITDEYLVVNEFMGHILQFPPANIPWYFGEHLPNQMAAPTAGLRSILPARETRTLEGRPFWPDLAETFAREADAFSLYVTQRWNLQPGRPWR
ncbi:MAG: hypothetical protein FWH12_04905 [Treponema sp.]|nr:hypothetical protein [Treponema sp.]